MHKLTRVFTVLAASLLWAGSAGALSTTAPTGSLALSLSVGGVEVWAPVVAGTPDPADGPYAYDWADGQWQSATHGVKITWQDVEGDIDPGVNGVWAITNNSAITQIYTLTVILPILPVAPSSLMFGSSTISVADANFSGSATLASVGGFPGYEGLIDLAAVPAAALFTAPYSLVAPPGGTIGDTETFGVFPGSVPGPAALTSIGIRHTFSLTAGDTATFNSTFHIVPIPEPGTLVLIGAGLAGLGLLRRQRA